MVKGRYVCIKWYDSKVKTVFMKYLHVLKCASASQTFQYKFPGFTGQILLVFGSDVHIIVCFCSNACINFTEPHVHPDWSMHAHYNITV